MELLPRPPHRALRAPTLQQFPGLRIRPGRYTAQVSIAGPHPVSRLDVVTFSTDNPRPVPSLPGLFALALVLLLAAGQALAVVSAVDDRGRTLHLEQPARRIISLAPHLTENLFAIGAGDRLVGVTTFSDHPPGARRIEIIGTYKDFDIERIIELDPDVVFGWISGNPAEPVARMDALGLPMFLTEPREIEHVAGEILRLGHLTGLDAEARRVAADFEARIDSIRRLYSKRDIVPVFYQVWHDPLITLSGDHLISKLITGCGGRNVFDDIDALAPRVGVEAVLARDPEAIITGGAGNVRPEWLDEWHRYGFLLAAKRDNLFHVNPDIVQRHTTRLADGMAALCEIIDTARRRRP